MPDQLQLIEQLWYFGEIAVHPHTPQAVGCGSLQRTLRYAVAWQLLWSSAFELLVQKFRCFEVCPYVQIYVTLTELLNLPPSCLNPILRVELPPSSIRAPVKESNNRDFKVQCHVMESNFGHLEFEYWRGSRTNGNSKFSVRSWSRTLGFFRFESRRCRRSFRVKIRGSKPEKPGFYLASCNMQLLANYTKYYTVAIFTRKSLIYIVFWRAWISVNP